MNVLKKALVEGFHTVLHLVKIGGTGVRAMQGGFSEIVDDT